MTNVSLDVCRRLKEARRARGLSQSAVAERIGCKQSALSMFETGAVTKLGDAHVTRLAELLNVDIKAKPETNDEATPTVAPIPTMPLSSPLAFCPSATCLSNLPYVVEGRLLSRPLGGAFGAGQGPRCRHCGELLERRCPNCGAPVNEGACCAVCGEPYVAILPPAGITAEAWATQERAKRIEIRSFL